MKKHLTIKSSTEIKGIIARLTPTEREILHFVLMFLNNNEIAELMQTTEKAVRWHMTGIYSAFGIGRERDRSNKRNQLLRECYGLNHRPCANPFPSGFMPNARDGRRNQLYKPNRVTIEIEGNQVCQNDLTELSAGKSQVKLIEEKQSLPQG